MPAAVYWMTPEEMAERYKVSLATIYQWRYKGTGPRAHKLGRHLRFRSDDVEVWEAEQAQPNKVAS